MPAELPVSAVRVVAPDSLEDLVRAVVEASAGSVVRVEPVNRASVVALAVAAEVRAAERVVLRAGRIRG